MTAAVWAWLIAAGKWIISNRFAQIALALIAAFGWHKARVWQAKQKTVETERKEAKAKAVEKKAEHEDSIDDARDELHERQKERRDDEANDDPRSRFGKQPRD